jgi:hypothetical protein
MAADAWKTHAALLLVQLNYGAYHVVAKLAVLEESTSWSFACYEMLWL